MLTSDTFHQILQESEILGDLFFHQVLQESEIVLGWMELGFQPGFENSLFFMLTKEALDTGLIKFVPPNGIWQEGYDIWDVASDEIVAYLRDNFPKDATDGLDSCVNNYFYDIAPAVLWRQDDGSYYGS